MLDTHEIPYSQPAGDGFTVRTVADARDVDRVAEFNGLIHGPGVAGMTRSIFLHHPHTRGRDLIFVEEDSTGQVVSSLCVIPWVWRIDSAVIRSGEMGIVGTLAPYRRRGLIRAQAPYYQQRLRERGCVLSHIQGIPNYYRQFGYEYAMPLEGGIRLEHRDVPKPGDAPFTFRLAASGDIPALMALYDVAARDANIHTVRDRATWDYLLSRTAGTDMEAEHWLMHDAAGAVAGYLRLPRYHFDAELTVNETSRLSYDAAVAALQHLKALSIERGAPGLRLALPRDGALARLALACGAQDRGCYAWQIMLPDLPAFLRALAPALEQRIAGSPFAGLTREVPLGFYRQHYCLRFERGRLADVADTGLDDRGNNLPLRAFIPLALGYRSLEEQHAAFPDLGLHGSWRMLFETLFPRLKSFLCTVY